jgi:hypothetical protein
MLVLQAENERQRMPSRLTILPYRVMIMLYPRWMINGWLQVLKAEGRELHLPPRAFVMKTAPLDNVPLTPVTPLTQSRSYSKSFNR